MNYKQMTSKDIWNLFNSGNLDLDKLEKEDLDTIFYIEMEELERNSVHDMSLMEKCAGILMHKYSDNVTAREFTIDDIAAIEKEVLSREQNNKTKYKRSIPKRRLIAYVAAVAILVAILSVVVAASFNLFEGFGVTLRDIFNMGGSTVTDNKGNDLNIGDGFTYYKTFEELSDTLDFEILHPSGDFDNEIVEIYATKMIGYNMIHIEVKTIDDARVICNVYYGDKAYENYGDEQLKNEPTVQQTEWNGHNIYYMSYDGQYQANLYVDDVIYIFISDVKENIEHVVSQLE